MTKYADKILLAIAFGLVILGLMIVFSASSSFAMLKKDDFAYFFNHQMQVVVMAFLAFLGGLLVPYRLYKKIGLPLMFLITIALIVVLFSSEKKGASRWIDLGFYSFQPAEFAKIILVFNLARLTLRLGEEIENLKKLVVPLGWTFLFAFLISLQPNYSNAIIIVVLGLAMIYIGGAKFKHVFGIALTGGLIFLAVMWFTPHSHARLAGWLDSASRNAPAPSTQVNEALVGLGSGGVSGVGIGKSQQSNLFLPEAYGDFIFAILGEELGFIGTVVVSTMYVFFFLVSLLTIQHIKNDFGKLIVFGLAFNIVLSAMFNIAVVLGLVPTTGITLPFISYGGSSLFVFVFSVGVMLNVVTDGSFLEKMIRTVKKIFHAADKFENAKF